MESNVELQVVHTLAKKLWQSTPLNNLCNSIQHDCAWHALSGARLRALLTHLLPVFLAIISSACQDVVPVAGRLA